MKGSDSPRLVRVAYLDHLEFKECKSPGHEKPGQSVAYGFLQEDASEFIRLTWLVEGVDEPEHQGLVIIRSCVLEVEEFVPKKD